AQAARGVLGERAPGLRGDDAAARAPEEVGAKRLLELADLLGHGRPQGAGTTDDAVMTRDVVIVGGGIAGLAAAWRLRHRDVLLLEGSDRLGGRMRSDPCGDYWLNYGAHLFPAPGSLVDRMATECGLETVPVFGGMMGLAVGDTILDGGRVESYPFRLPLSVKERI